MEGGGQVYALDYFSQPRGDQKNCNVYLLTHVHTDHLSGLKDGWKKGTIYCTEQSEVLLRTMFDLEVDRVKTLTLNVKTRIHLGEEVYIDVVPTRRSSLFRTLSSSWPLSVPFASPLTVFRRS